MRPGTIPEEHRDVSLREMLEAMARHGDDETFRWYQTSYIDALGCTAAGPTLRVSVGQARRELGIIPSP